MVSALREKCDIQAPCYCHLEQQGYELHGTSTHTCKQAEDREGSKEQMAEVQDGHQQSAGISFRPGQHCHLVETSKYRSDFSQVDKCRISDHKVPWTPRLSLSTLLESVILSF